jgi:RNA ligase (TIGR02306 family)
MAELKVEVVQIDSIHDHPNADRLEIAWVGGYQVCVQKDLYLEQQEAVYIPVDSILPENLEAFIFGANAKVKLNKHRVRCIKLRGAVSQGMLMTVDEVLDYFVANKISQECLLGYDLTGLLGITKYQPPAAKIPSGMANAKAAPKRHCHPMFSKYTDIGHLKKYWNAFTEGENIIITEKIHGTNFRCGWVPFIPRTFWQKVKKIFGQNPNWEFVYGSHNVQLMDGGKKKKDAFAGNVYKRIVDEHNLTEKISRGHLWFGEIFGYGIQKNYSYGMKEGKVDVAFMDIKDVTLNEYLDFHAMVDIVESKGEQVVPYTEGKFDKVDILATLNDIGLVSFVDNKTYPIEGFVVRRYRSEKFFGGRLILKLLSDEYLLRKDTTDWH